MKDRFDLSDAKRGNLREKENRFGKEKSRCWRLALAGNEKYEIELINTLKFQSRSTRRLANRVIAFRLIYLGLEGGGSPSARRAANSFVINLR